MKRVYFYRVFGLLAATLLVSGVLAQGTYRNQRIFVVPAPGPVTIDGDLKDWDLSGEILTFVSEATSDFQSGRTALMYDRDALYVSLRAADPSPMMNRNDPAVNPDYGWDADAFQLRLCLDPAMGYPINIGWGQGAMASDNLVHMTMWYYTDTGKPVLHLKYGMNYHDAPDYPKGIVPADKFQAAFRKWEDGKGYTLEYRIPWATLRAPRPLTGGDIVAGALQIQWSDPDGKHSVGSGWAVDLMRQAGFSYQHTGCWGKVIFTDHGNLPKELTQEGLPPVRTLPLKFEYTLPQESVVSAVLINDKGDRVRHIIAAQTRPAGKLTENWDGLDDAGRVLPPGRYTYKAAYHDPFQVKYIMSVGNSGSPGYHTPDGKGAWGGDWAPPQDVCVAGDKILISWAAAEAGPGIIMLDAAGKKQWGGRFGATNLATDGEWLFAYLPHEKQVRAYAVADGKQINFLRGELWIEPNAGKETLCTGLTWVDGKLYVADADSNTVSEYDAKQGKLLRRLTVESPNWLATVDKQTLAVLSGRKVLKLNLADGAVTPWITDRLDLPRALTVGPDGTAYISCQGRAQNVAVYSREGQYLRSIGLPGGRPTRGTWKPEGMYRPRGLALDGQGRLWVTEDDYQPKRVSLWDARTGKFLDEKFGACYVSTPACMDPTDPTRIYCQNVEWKVDLDKGTWQPAAVMIDNRPDSPYFWPHMVNNEVFTAKNGRQYMIAGYGYGGPYPDCVQQGHFLYIRRGDHFEGCAGVIRPSQKLSWREKLPENDPLRKSSLLWVDLNGDSVIQPEECKPTKLMANAPHGRVDADLNLYTAGMYNYLYWQRVSPTKLLPNGVPLYDENTVVTYDYAKDLHPLYTYDLAVNPADGSVLMYAGADIKYMDKLEVWPLTYWTRDGQRLWRFRKGCRWHDMYEFPIPKADELYGCTRCLGITDGLTGFTSYFGQCHLITTDGLALGNIMQDGRSAAQSGPDRINCEWFSGQLVKLKDGRWFLLGGDQDGRVLQVLGLDTIKRFEGTYTITEDDTKAAAQALAEWSANQAKAQVLTIARTVGPPDWINIRPVTVTVDEKRAFTVKAARDEANLYLQYQVDAPAELTNSLQETQMIFKGGNCLDLQLATDPQADPERKTPAPGDLRVLITRRDKQPLAVAYRYKVAGFTGQPTVFTSPTGQESVDQIEIWDDLKLTYEKTPLGFLVTVTLPLERLGWKPVPGTTVKMDVGYLFGNETGNTVTVRKYWSNSSFTAGVTNDVPHESRIEPAQWGTAVVE